MPWLILFLAGVCEIAWAVGLKYTEGFTRLWPSVWTVIALFVSFILLAQAVKDLPVGTAYAVWTGIGAAGTAVLSMFLFNESRDPMRVLCIALILIGIIGLNVFTRQS